MTSTDQFEADAANGACHNLRRSLCSGNVPSRYFSTLAFLAAVCGILCNQGCTSQDERYRVITEEISGPERTEAVRSETANESSQPATGTPSDQPSIESNVGESSTTAAEPSLPAETTTPAPKPQQAAAGAENGADVAISAPVPGSLGGLINLEEEMKRQRRLQLLNLNKDETPSEPRPIKLLIPENDFTNESRHNALRISYDDLDLLKILNMDPVPLDADEHLPEWLTALDGQRVILRGWMFPPDRAEGIKGFIFVRDNQVCCFGPNAKAYDKLTVRLKAGQTTKFIQGRPFDVLGTFRIDPWIEDERDMKTGAYLEKLGMLYHLEEAVIVDE